VLLVYANLSRIELIAVTDRAIDMELASCARITNRAQFQKLMQMISRLASLAS